MKQQMPATCFATASFYVVGRCQALLSFTSDSIARAFPPPSGPPTPSAVRAGGVTYRVSLCGRDDTHAGSALGPGTPGLAFYPSTRASARLPETIQSQAEHECCGTLFVTVADWRALLATVRTARVTIGR